MRPILHLILSALAAATVLLALAGPATAAPSRFDTGLQDPTDPAFADPDAAHALDAAAAERVSTIRVPVSWRALAPTRPDHPRDPADPAYGWGGLDARVAAIVAHGMEPMLVLYDPPEWARPGGKLTARGTTFGPFAEAIATRYDGSGEQPRVRLWQIWNEPNIRRYLARSHAPQRYRELVNAAYGPIHAAAAGNLVVAGGLGPLGDPNGTISQAPMSFMRAVLSARTSFDVWSHHPYTTGGPNRHAISPNDVFVADLPEMKRVLDSARRAGHVRSAGGAPAFWITEFSWDTNPPDPGGLPLRTQARWAAEAFYRMWSAGVSFVSWFQLRDYPKGFAWGDTPQGGLYRRTTKLYADEKVKPVARVLRFPFVAVLAGGGRVTLWGRTPDSSPASVTIERRSGGAWRRVTTLQANAHGVFNASRSGLRGALLRARVGGDTALPFKAVHTRDRRVAPFGGNAG